MLRYWYERIKCKFMLSDHQCLKVCSRLFLIAAIRLPVIIRSAAEENSRGTGRVVFVVSLVSVFVVRVRAWCPSSVWTRLDSTPRTKQSITITNAIKTDLMRLWFKFIRFVWLMVFKHEDRQVFECLYQQSKWSKPRLYPATMKLEPASSRPCFIIP